MSESAEKDDNLLRFAKIYLPLVETIALEYHNTPNASHEELVSEGRMALLKAIRSFDPARGNFISYASTAIRNRLNDFYEKQVRQAEAFPIPISSPPHDEQSTQTAGQCTQTRRLTCVSQRVDQNQLRFCENRSRDYRGGFKSCSRQSKQVEHTKRSAESSASRNKAFISLPGQRCGKYAHS